MSIFAAMKQLLRHFPYLLLLPLMFLAACAKDDTKPDDEPAQQNQGSFTWLLSNGQSLSADSAYAFKSITTVYAFKGSNNIEINLSSLSPGTYSISSATGNSFSYVNAGATSSGTAGNVVISANTANALSGSFSVSLSGGTLTSVTGSFNDIRTF